MEQWQGCLAPVCQLALKRAHETVAQRGGNVVTVEDLLLALLDVDTALAPFLTRWGIDLDELVRTVQCEQPLSPHPGAEAGLSDSLIDWLAGARERCDRPWLNTHHLLPTLCAAERFQDKAYVAVLEQVPVPAWEALSLSPVLPGQQAEAGAATATPNLVQPMESGAVTAFPLSSSAHGLATDLVTRTLEPRGGILWLQSSSDIRVEGLLGQVQRMALAVVSANFRRGEMVKRRWYRVEWERAGEEDGTLERLFAAMTRCAEDGRPSVFLLQACSPAVLTLLIQRIGILKWRRMLAVARPLVVLSSPPLKHSRGPESWLEDSLGLQLQRFSVPLLSNDECLRYLRFRQAGMERKWHMEIADSALQAAASLARTNVSKTAYSVGADTDPDRAMNLLQDALNAKLTTQANGSASMIGLRASREDLERRHLLAQARTENAEEVLDVLREVCLELAAEEVHWNEHTAPVASVLVRNDVVRQALRRAGVPLIEADERIRMLLENTRRQPITLVERDSR